jgi:FtsH-binding integral membrane protein
MENSRRSIQVIRFVMAGSIVVYGLLCWWLPTSVTPSVVVFRAVSLMSVLLVVVIFVMRRIQVSPAAKTLSIQPQDEKALVRWRQGYLATYTLSEAIALHGLVLDFLGNSLLHVAPFFVAGLGLILGLAPTSPGIDNFQPDADVKH